MKFDAFLPVAAPAPAGLVIGIHLYKEVIAALGVIPADYFGWVSLVVGVFAALGCVGMIGVEMTAYKQAGIALAEKQQGAAIIAAVAGVVCSLLIIWAIWTSDSARPLVVSVIISIAGYVALSARDFLARRRGVAQTVTIADDKDKNHELEMEKQKTNQARAAARAAQAGSVRAVRDVTRTDEQPREQTNSRALPTEKIAEIHAYQKEHPNAPVREVSAACGVSVGSVSKYGAK